MGPITLSTDHFCLQFDVLMTAYKKHSRQWSAVFNKFAEGMRTVC